MPRIRTQICADFRGREVWRCKGVDPADGMRTVFARMISGRSRRIDTADFSRGRFCSKDFQQVLTVGLRRYGIGVAMYGDFFK